MRPVLALVALALALLLVPSVGGGATGKADFVGGFESGSFRPWHELQAEFDRPQDDSFEVVTSPVRSGRYAAGFAALQGYSPFGYGESSMLCCGGTPYAAEGSEYWYAWSTLFPSDWRAPYRWGILLQWHSGFGVPPPLAISASYTTMSIELFTGALTKRSCDDTDCGSAQYARHMKFVRDLSTGRWNDFVLHVRWTSSARGVVEIWHRVEGDKRYHKALGLSRVPTLQRFDAETSPVYTLLGIYRASYCAQPTELGCTSDLDGGQPQPPTVVYHDGYTRSRTPFAWCPECRTAYPRAR